MQKVLNNIYPPVMKIFVSFRERQMPSQNLQKNEAAKKKKKKKKKKSRKKKKKKKLYDLVSKQHSTTLRKYVSLNIK